MDRDIKMLGRGLTKRRVFIALLLIIALFAILGDKGLIDLYRVRGELDGIQTYNRALEKENREIEKEIALLKGDRRYIEHIAKKELGMIRKNEVIYKIRPGE